MRDPARNVVRIWGVPLSTFEEDESDDEDESDGEEEGDEDEEKEE